MPILAVECGKCGAKLKIKSGLARTPAEIKCPKCGKMIPVSKDAIASAAASAASAAAVATPPPPPPEESAPAAQPEREEAVPDVAPASASEPVPVPQPVSVIPPPLPVTPSVAPPPAPETPPAPATTPIPSVAPASASAPAVAPPPAMPSGVFRKPSAPIVLSHLGEQHGALNLTVKCPACNWQTKVREELIGKRIRCKQCGGTVPVLAADTPASVTAAPVAPITPVVPMAETMPAPAPVPEPAPIPVAAAPVAEPPAAPAVSRAASGRVTLDRDEPTIRLATKTPTAPALMPVSMPAPVAPPKPASVTSSTVDALVAEVAQVKTRLIQLDGQKNEALRRAEAAEKAFQEQAGHRAIDEMNARRRLAELESQAQAQRALLAELKAATEAELQAATQQVAALQQRLHRLG